MDEGADAEGEVGDGKGGSEGLGVDGEGSLGGAIEGGGEFQQGAGGAIAGDEDGRIRTQSWKQKQKANNETDVEGGKGQAGKTS